MTQAQTRSATVAAMDNQATDRIAALALDQGVLAEGPLLEIGGWRAVATHDGRSVVPWRGPARTAEAAGVSVAATADELGDERFPQAVVHLEKGRDATWAALAAAWRRLEPGGRLVLVGGNDLGIKSAAARLGRELGQAGQVLANRARGRAVGFERSDHPGPAAPATGSIEVVAGEDRFNLVSSPGVFSADALDPGSQLLLEHLDSILAAERVFDPGCGLGALGLAALRRFPGAAAVLADADGRALRAARANAANLGLAERCQVVWWDAECEPPPLERCDLVLCNPPFHRGVAVDLAVPRAMFGAIDAVLAPGGTALVVSLRTLPFERDLVCLGRLDQLADEHGYKLLRVRR